jgi:alpha-L-rhamnosidase
MLNSSCWKAQWITPSYKSPVKQQRLDCFHATPYLGSRPKIGRAYVRALGWYRLFINGDDRTGNALVPRWTPLDEIVEYQAYDITDCLSAGENHIGIVVGDGRYRGWLGLWDGPCRYGDQLATLAQLEIDLENGEHVTFSTDTNWMAGHGHILTSDQRYGEHVDMRISDNAWLRKSNSGPSSAKLSPVKIIESTKRRLVAEEVDRLYPKSITSAPSGAQIVDFGQNLAGYVRVKLRGAEGTRITLAFSEILNQRGELDIHYRLPYLRFSPQQDTVILSSQVIHFQPWVHYPRIPLCRLTRLGLHVGNRRYTSNCHIVKSCAIRQV